MKKIRKAIFPVGGLGTRFLPATKTVPKEMLPIVDKPAIQYIVEEAEQAGIEQLIFVTGRNKGVIEDYFDVQTELYATLERRNKRDALSLLQDLQPLPGRAYFTRQQYPLGLGHAVWCARDLVGNEPFALLLPDMVMQSPCSCLQDMIALYNKVGGNVISVQECSPKDVSKYGIIDKTELFEGSFKITQMVEKPDVGHAPSNFYMNGRYILQPEIFDILESQEQGAGEEVQLTDAMRSLLLKQDFFAYHFKGRTFDCGSKLGFIEANLSFALEHEEIHSAIKEILRHYQDSSSKTA